MGPHKPWTGTDLNFPGLYSLENVLNLQGVQNRVSRANWKEHISPLFKGLYWIPFQVFSVPFQFVCLSINPQGPSCPNRNLLSNSQSKAFPTAPNFRGWRGNCYFFYGPTPIVEFPPQIKKNCLATPPLLALICQAKSSRFNHIFN